MRSETIPPYCGFHRCHWLSIATFSHREGRDSKMPVPVT
jgi:hypothetical protein